MDAVKLPAGDTQQRWYVVDEHLEDGRVIMRPETPLEAAHRQHGSRPATQAEFDQLLAPYLLPADDEG